MLWRAPRSVSSCASFVVCVLTDPLGGACCCHEMDRASAIKGRRGGPGGHPPNDGFGYLFSADAPRVPRRFGPSSAAVRPSGTRASATSLPSGRRVRAPRAGRRPRRVIVVCRAPTDRNSIVRHGTEPARACARDESRQPSPSVGGCLRPRPAQSWLSTIHPAGTLTPTSESIEGFQVAECVGASVAAKLIHHPKPAHRLGASSLPGGRLCEVGSPAAARVQASVGGWTLRSGPERVRPHRSVSRRWALGAEPAPPIVDRAGSVTFRHDGRLHRTSAWPNPRTNLRSPTDDVP